MNLEKIKQSVPAIKNYIFVFLFLLLIFAANHFISAKLPSFEVYPDGSTPWPAVTNVQVSQTATTVILTADVSDVSGILSVVAEINPSGLKPVMYDDGLHGDGEKGDGKYGVMISNSSIGGGGTYSVNISATDRLINNSWKLNGDYENITSFVLYQGDDASLSNLTVSTGSLSPSFSPSTTDYSVDVSNSVTGIKVTPTAGQLASVITVNGSPVVSGSASALIPLVVGENTIAVMVTAPNEITEKNYTIIVNRSLSDVAVLNGLVTSSGSLSPSFHYLTVQYAVAVSSGVSNITVTPTSQSASAILVNDVEVASGSESGGIPLDIGENTITIKVIALDGTTERTYTLAVTREDPGDFLLGWQYRKKIVISTLPSSNLNNFPLLVKISSDEEIGRALATGNDIRFTTADGQNTFLAYEREHFTISGGVATGVFWVKIPTIYSAPTGTQNTFYLYYGNIQATEDWTVQTSTMANCTSITNAKCVWKEESLQSFKGVWHLPNGTSLSGADSTAIASNGTNSGSTPVLGKIDGGASFNGSSQYVSTNLDVQPSAIPSITWEAWVMPNSVSAHKTVFSNDDGGYDRGVQSSRSGDGKFNIFTGVGAWTPTTTTLNEWQHIAVVYTSTNIYFYKNGVQYVYGSAPSGQASALKFNIGRNPGYGEYFAGSMDEVRVSNVARSADWINFSYRNQNEDLVFQSLSSKDISYFSFSQGVGDINGTNIIINVHPSTDITSLVATFTATGQTVKVGGVTQSSGVTPNDFTTPVIYEVLALDGSSKEYTVIVNLVNPIYTSELWTNKTEDRWGYYNYYNDPYNLVYPDSRAQFIVTRDDLISAGLVSGGTINAVYLKTDDPPIFNIVNFTVRAKLVPSSVIQTTGWEGGWTTLYGPTTLLPSDQDLSLNGRWKKYDFIQNFQWDETGGQKNIMFDILRNDDDSVYNYSGGMYMRTNIGTNRMFAGYSPYNCTSIQLSERISGNCDGYMDSYCPSLKIDYQNP